MLLRPIRPVKTAVKTVYLYETNDVVFNLLAVMISSASTQSTGYKYIVHPYQIQFPMPL